MPATPSNSSIPQFPGSTVSSAAQALRVRLADNDSRNGTFRNRVPVAECQLVDGDEIKVGSSRLLFLCSDSGLPNAGLNIQDQEIDPETVISIKSEEVIYLNVGQESLDAGQQSPLSRAMSLLVRLSSGIQVTAGVEALAESVLSALVDCVPAEHGTVLLFERECEEPAWRYSLPAGKAGDRGIPRQLINRAVRDRVAVLCNGSVAANSARCRTSCWRPCVMAVTWWGRSA